MKLKKGGLLWKIAYGWRKFLDCKVSSIPEQTDLCQFVRHVVFGFLLGWPSAFVLLVLSVFAIFIVTVVCSIISLFFGHYVSFSGKKGDELFKEYPLPTIHGIRIVPIYPLALAWIIHVVYKLPTVIKEDKLQEGFYGQMVVITSGAVGLVLIAGLLMCTIYLCKALSSVCTERGRLVRGWFEGSEFFMVCRARVQSFKDGTCVRIKFE